MGVRCLNKFIDAKCCNSITEVSLSSLYSKRIVIDANIYMYRYNENNQLLSVYYKKQEIRRYEYDQYGNLIKEFNSLENYLEKTHQYDSLNRLIETKAFVDRKYLLGIHSYKYDKEGRTIEYTELDHKKKVFKILLYQYLDESSILEIYYKKRKRKKRKPDEIYAIKYEFW